VPVNAGCTPGSSANNPIQRRPSDAAVRIQAA
jgi:hypothetical protein